jgi:hypothetical protein
MVGVFSTAAPRYGDNGIAEIMAEQITIPISVFEVSIAYKRPFLSVWLNRGTIVQALFDTFQPWGVNVDDIEPITAGKPSEQGVKFKLPLHKITFFFGPAGCKFTKETATWNDAEETLRVLNAALEILVRHGEVELGKKSTSLALHLQPQSVSFKELLFPFLAAAIAQMEPAKAEAMAYIVRWKGRRITLDGSAALANGLFANLERDFDPTVSFDEIKTVILNDELNLFRLLNVEEVAS